ncbi:MAG: class I SAM-dependent methyltransferase [Anaerolineales bacterium]|nr:class I SAM-dependent methyltransferase [Anaerolineales bacterium]
MFRRLFFEWLYLFRPPWDSGIPAPELVRVVAERPAGTALDLGCGTGTQTRYLAEHGWQVTGIDFVPRAVEQAQRKNRAFASQVTLLTGDVTKLEQLPLPGPYDLALDMGCFHSLSDAGRERYIAGLSYWLKPGGLFMLYAFQPAPNQPPQPQRAGQPAHLPKEKVVELFANSFTLTHYEQGTGRPSAWYYFSRR